MAVLIDDFTASGSSFIRKKKDGSFGGKLPTFFETIEKKQKFKDLFTEGFEIHLYFLIATNNSLNHIRALLEEYMAVHTNLKVDVDCVHLLGEDAKFTNHQEPAAKDMMAVIEKKCYVNEPALTDAYKESYPEGNKDYHLGYKQCALTVVLNHNTPNNSLPIIWQPGRDGADRLYPLFYRITRH